MRKNLNLCKHKKNDRMHKNREDNMNEKKLYFSHSPLYLKIVTYILWFFNFARP